MVNTQDKSSATYQVVISVDVEDWVQSTWDRDHKINERTARNTALVLDILATHDVKATMFVLGKFAERFPRMVQRIAAEGHEVASHGYGHIEVFKQTPSEFRADLLRSKYLLEDLISKPVLGYRAPDFSIISTTLWALEVIAENGFTYDSSIFPIVHNRYGISWWPIEPRKVILQSGQMLVELPVSSFDIFNSRIPVAGGGYHRILPERLILLTIRKILDRGRPFISYFHPYEFNPGDFDGLDIKIPWRVRVHQGFGRKNTRMKFEKILKTFNTVEAFRLVGQKVWADYKLYLEMEQAGLLG